MEKPNFCRLYDAHERANVLIQYVDVDQNGTHEVRISCFYYHMESLDERGTSVFFQDLDTAFEYIEKYSSVMAVDFIDRFLPDNQ